MVLDWGAMIYQLVFLAIFIGVIYFLYFLIVKYQMRQNEKYERLLEKLDEIIFELKRRG